MSTLTNRFSLLTAAIAAVFLVWATPAQAQDYGTGATLTVPEVDPSAMTMDGQADEAAWENAATVDMVKNWATYAVSEPDISANARLLYSQDTLYVYSEIQDYSFYWGTPGNAWQGEQILIGVDGTHSLDDMTDDTYAGWPGQAPDSLTVYKVTRPESGGITLNFGGLGYSPADSGWVNGNAFVNEDTFVWGVETAIYVPQIEDGAEIGFNIGGAAASQERADGNEGEDGAYSYYAWQTLDSSDPGLAVQNYSGNYATLQMGESGGGGSADYGTGVSVQVPQVDPSEITIDGDDSETAWEDATTVDALANVSFFAITDQPDLQVETKLLWGADTLYVHMRALDTDLFFPADSIATDQFLIGIDGTHMGDSLYASSFDGAPSNAPDGPVAYKVDERGLTLNFASVAGDSLVNDSAFVDENALTWGVEAAIYVPQAEKGAQIGFNVGGGQASEEAYENESEATYGFYSWQVCDPAPSGDSFCELAGGSVMSDARSFATLDLVQSVGVVEAPAPRKGEALTSNYPNPFRQATTFEYTLDEPGRVTLTIYDLLGRRVKTLVSGQRAARTYRVQWTPEDLPAGLYVGQLRVDGNVVATQQMTLVR